MRVFIIICACCLPAFSDSYDDSKINGNMPQEPGYKEGFVEFGTASIHYIDWGGAGLPLILIPGLGDTPYIFTDLASVLKEDIRLIAYSRRDQCKSKSFNGRYDNDELISDLRHLMDGLGLEKANLLGWSMGGNEITGFAALYPERTNKLIYLEAGYDLSDNEFNVLVQGLPVSYQAGKEDLQTIDAYRRWFHRFWFPDIPWNETLEANLRASVLINNDSSISTIPNDSITRLILGSAMKYHREYDKVSAPGLFFFSGPFFFPPDPDSITASLYDAMETSLISPWRKRSIQRIRNKFRNPIIVEMNNGSHTSMIFRERDSIAATIKEYLLSKP